ncbi:MAG: branched-chain amino acid ABC transporter substrate-binding protein [Chloroflexi bacterium]|nr:branched-chain amino acid ABC transporter substrate-binding protein [Chloroflexota bacterium]
MKRFTLLLLLSLLLALSLAACGGTASEPAASEETAVEEPAAEEPAAEEPAADDMECTDPLGCVEVAPGDPISLASALVISGPNTELGLDSQWGVEIALDFYGDVLGHPVILLAEDDGCSAEGGQTAAQKIVSNPDIVAMVGTSCSGAGVPAAKIISDAGYAMVSPSNTAASLTDPELHEAGYLRTAHNDNVQGRAMAEYAFKELGITKAAAIHDGDPYTEGLASVFADSFKRTGW